MVEEKEKKPQPMENPHQISRREFAIGTVAALGGYALAEASPLPPLSPEAQAMKLEVSESVKELLDARHIVEDDIRRVIDHAEKTGDKLYHTDSSEILAKLLVKEVYFYVEYAPVEGAYRIYTAYSHRFLLEDD